MGKWVLWEWTSSELPNDEDLWASFYKILDCDGKSQIKNTKIMPKLKCLLVWTTKLHKCLLRILFHLKQIIIKKKKFDANEIDAMMLI